MNSLFPPESRIIIYRIFQECLHNITKHAGPCRVSVALRQDDGGVILSIDDDGVGFDVAQIAKRDASRRGLGLAALDERSRMLGGSCQFWSRQGVGTKVVCRIPIPPKKDEPTAAPGGRRLRSFRGW